MPTLTKEEKDLFSQEALTELLRMPPSRMDEYLVPEEPDSGEFRARSLAKLTKLTGPQMRARVNVIGVSWGRVPVVNYDTASTYTPAERDAIADGLVQGSGWVYQLADITERGPSTNQRLDALERAP